MHFISNCKKKTIESLSEFWNYARLIEVLHQTGTDISFPFSEAMFHQRYHHQVETKHLAPLAAVRFSSRPQSSRMSLCEWYANRVVLLTGVTSEVGNVLLEKILRCLPDVRVYVVLRSRNGLSGEERIKKIFASPGYEWYPPRRSPCACKSCRSLDIVFVSVKLWSRFRSGARVRRIYSRGHRTEKDTSLPPLPPRARWFSAGIPGMWKHLTFGIDCEIRFSFREQSCTVTVHFNNFFSQWSCYFYRSFT